MTVHMDLSPSRSSVSAPSLKALVQNSSSRFRRRQDEDLFHLPDMQVIGRDLEGNSNGTDTEWPKLVMKKCKGKNCYPEYKID